MNKVKKLLSFFILSILLLPEIIFGQSISIPGQVPELEEQISVIVDPELPRSYENINIKVEAYGTDLTRAFITWKVNNKTVKSGRGEQSFELNSGKVGNSQVVSIIIQPTGGPAIVKNLTFKPQEIDLLWEARSYTPPFYKGKALQGFMGDVVVVAIPNFVSNGKLTQTRNATYKWQRNGDAINNESGFGKNSVSFKGGILLKPEEIEVEVTDDNFNRSKQTVAIEPMQPFALLYENNPLYGILFNKKVNQTVLKNGEVSFSAVPYFFETPSKKSSLLKYSWKINGQESFVFNTDKAIFRYEDKEAGSSFIDLTVSHQTNFLQEASVRASIKLEPKPEKIEF